MQRWPVLLAITAVAVVLCTFTACSRVDPENGENGTSNGDDPGKKVYTTEELAGLASRAIAYIEAPSAATPQWYSFGSGFVIDAEGIIVTNYHVMEGAGSAIIEVDGRVYDDVMVVAASEEWDLAILKIDARELTALPLGVGIEAVNLGEEVLALGNPEGFKGTVSNGIVSSIRRDLDLNIDMIQTTAPISKGSSGGPLLNMYGEVIGVNTLTYLAGQNLNFAVPVDLVRRLMENAAGTPELTVAEVFGSDLQTCGHYTAAPGEFAVILSWEGKVDLDLEIWSEDFEFLLRAYEVDGCADIDDGSRGEEWFVFQEYKDSNLYRDNDLSRDFNTGRFIVSSYFFGPEESEPVYATLSISYPDGRQEVVLEQIIDYYPPYDQWFAAIIDVDRHSYKIMDFFVDSEMVAILEWDTEADLDLVIYHHGYDEAFTSSEFGGYDFTDGRVGLESFSLGPLSNETGFYDFGSGVLDIYVLMDQPGLPVTEAAVTLLTWDGLETKTFNHTFTSDPRGDYGWIALFELDMATLNYIVPSPSEARFYFD